MQDMYGNVVELAPTDRVRKIKPNLAKSFLVNVLRKNWVMVTDLSSFGDFEEGEEVYEMRINAFYGTDFHISPSTLLVDIMEQLGEK